MIPRMMEISLDFIHLNSLMIYKTMNHEVGLQVAPPDRQSTVGSRDRMVCCC